MSEAIANNTIDLNARKLELSATRVHPELSLCSIAISLKRIADVMENVDHHGHQLGREVYHAITQALSEQSLRIK